ncbi:hypothetical protein GCM10025776_27990 [Corallincola platygyrae]
MIAVTPTLYLVPQVKQRVDVAVTQASDFYAGKDFGSSVAARLNVWHITAQQMLPKAPWTGFGYQGFKPELKAMAKSGEINRRFNWISHPHNEVLHLWVEQGLVGLSLMLSIWVLAYRSIVRTARQNEHADSVILSLRFLVGGLAVYGLTDTMTGNLITHTFFAGMLVWISRMAIDAEGKPNR